MLAAPLIPIRSPHLEGAEFAWFAPICDGDDRYLGKRDPAFKSSWANASQIVLKADQLGYRNILLPSSYQVGQDTLTFAAAVAPMTQQINLLAAIRCGEVHPPMLARSIATLDHILQGRLTLNIISSDLPGTQRPSKERYQISGEVIQILQQAWTQDEINFHGEHYQLQVPSDPAKPYQQGGPLLYFGGYSPDGVALCAAYCDVYLMWPETEGRLLALMTEMSQQAAKHGRLVDFGLRVHVIVRETESEARAAARNLMRELDPRMGQEIRERALDAQSYGVARQAEMRTLADLDGYAEDYLWTGIGQARSGCGAAIVGNPDQVADKIRRYMAMGIRAFIFSGYPHAEEVDYFARYVLPQFTAFSMPQAQGRIPAQLPDTPLGNGPRK